jgi:DNA-binding NarL/FixJ family response regulator
MVLSAEDDLEVVALAGDGASALKAVLTHLPDVLVVDTQMPGPRPSPSWSAWSARPSR